VTNEEAVKPGHQNVQAELDQRYAQFFKREMSLRASHTAWISARGSSIRRERMSPPWGLGAKLPVARRCASPRIAVDGDPPNRAAADRQLISPSIADRSGLRNPLIAADPSMLASSAGTNYESEITPGGIYRQFTTVENRSKGNFR
jgi:hypothetical protein